MFWSIIVFRHTHVSIHILGTTRWRATPSTFPAWIWNRGSAVDEQRTSIFRTFLDMMISSVAGTALIKNEWCLLNVFWVLYLGNGPVECWLQTVISTPHQLLVHVPMNLLLISVLTADQSRNLFSIWTYYIKWRAQINWSNLHPQFHDVNLSSITFLRPSQNLANRQDNLKMPPKKQKTRNEVDDTNISRL